MIILCGFVTTSDPPSHKPVVSIKILVVATLIYEVLSGCKCQYCKALPNLHGCMSSMKYHQKNLSCNLLPCHTSWQTSATCVCRGETRALACTAVCFDISSGPAKQ